MASGSTITSFRARVRGLAHDGSHLWSLDRSGQLNQLSATGEVLREVELPFDFAERVAFDGEHFWVSTEDEIHRIDVSDGSSLETIPVVGESPTALTFVDGTLWAVPAYTAYASPVGEPWLAVAGQLPEPEIYNLATDGTTFWSLEAHSMTVRQTDQHGEVVTTFDMDIDHAETPAGIALQSEELWVITNRRDEAHALYRLTLGGDILSTHTLPDDQPEAHGLAHDGQSLWYLSVDFMRDERHLYQLGL